MPVPTLLTDRIQPAWQALTPQQRTCWHWWAQVNPVTNDSGELRTLYGNQAHYRTNANLAIPTTPTLIHDPPTATRLVRAMFVVMPRVLGEDPPEVSFAVDEEVIEALAP